MCVLVLDQDRLHAANLGDSGFMVIRGNKILFKSPQQQHKFNFPFQLGYPAEASDRPDQAQVQRTKTSVLSMLVVVERLVRRVQGEEFCRMFGIAVSCNFSRLSCRPPGSARGNHCSIMKAFARLVCLMTLHGPAC